MIIFVFITLIFLTFFYFNKNKAEQPIQKGILLQVTDYQQQYWSIIKKHNMFLQIGEVDNNVQQDKTDLKKLYQNVENKINQNNKFLSELNNLNNKYNADIKNAQSQIEINIVANEYMENTDKILNNVYQEIKINTDSKDFELLKTSEIKWIKDLEEYQKFIEEQGFGSIIGLLYANATQDIKHFRTLLLIYYLEQNS